MNDFLSRQNLTFSPVQGHFFIALFALPSHYNHSWFPKNDVSRCDRISLLETLFVFNRVLFLINFTIDKSKTYLYTLHQHVSPKIIWLSWHGWEKVASPSPQFPPFKTRSTIASLYLKPLDIPDDQVLISFQLLTISFLTSVNNIWNMFHFLTCPSTTSHLVLRLKNTTKFLLWNESTDLCPYHNLCSLVEDL